MRTGKLNVKADKPRLHDRGLAPPPLINVSISRRARLLGASALASGALRGMAIAAGIVTVFGGSPTSAACLSTNSGFAGTCIGSASLGIHAHAVGENANADGTNATAFGFSANATGDNAAATG